MTADECDADQAATNPTNTDATNNEVSEVIETKFTTKDSGNWQLEMVKKNDLARDGDRIRRDLLSKLTYKKIWLTPAEKPDTHQTVFIYDWDDTLL